MLTSVLFGMYAIVAIGLEEMFPLFAATAIEYSKELHFKSLLKNRK